ncbi:hypothetical protein [Burkholderia cepacia]|uniref:hypothetical protein n=1 Tax=Burkholderia cepacia TaxID=292 RepID=UPI000B20518E|nr:hypothetical protein [Burkholderia cepacia]
MPRNGSTRCRESEPLPIAAQVAGIRRIGIRPGLLDTIGDANRPDRIPIAGRRRAWTSRPGAIVSPHSPKIRSPPAIPLRRNNYKIKVDQVKSLIQVDNSFKLFVELYLTCVTECSIFDNPENGMYSVMVINLIARMKEKP